MVSLYIALYLFLAGAGGGAFLLGSAVDLVLRFRPAAARGWFARVSVVTDAGLVLGPVLVVAGAAFLVLDLGVPEKALVLFVTSSQSLLSMGAWAILAFTAAALLALGLGALAGDGGEEGSLGEPVASGRVLMRVAEFVCSLAATGLALFVVVYSGVYLSLYPSLPFLNTCWVPVLFVASALTTGLAALIVVAFFRQQVPGVLEGVRGLLPVDAVLIALELAALVGLMVFSLIQGPPSATAALSLLSGALAPGFWAGVVLLGLLVPLAVDTVARPLATPMVAAVGGACTLAGGLLLRVVLLMATARFNLVFMSVLPFWN